MLLAVAMVFTSVNLSTFSTAFAESNQITGATEITYKGAPVTFGTSGQDINYNGNGDVTWYKLKAGEQAESIESYEKINEVPTNVGKYAVTVTPKQGVTQPEEDSAVTVNEDPKNEDAVAPFFFEITKADLHFTWPEKVSKVEDGTNKITVQATYNSGLVGKDDLENPVITTSATVDVTTPGEHNLTRVGGLCITPEEIDLRNYDWKNLNEFPKTAEITAKPAPLPPVEPEKPEIQEPAEPEIVMPEAPEVPQTGANIGMDQETDKTLGTILENILKPSTPDQEKPAPQTEAEKETAKTELAIAEAVQNAEQVKIAVETAKVEKETASQETKEDLEKIEKEIANTFGEKQAEILQFADIQVSAVAINQAGTERGLGNLRNLSDKIAFTVQLPADTEGENFGVARVHDGVMEFLPAEDVTYDPITKKITFKTDKFSTYAVYTYEDAPVAPEQPEQPEKPAKPAMVKNVKVKTDNGLLKVTFNKVQGADSYRVYVKQAGKDWRWYYGNNQGTMIKKIYKENLVKNGQYQVKVAAFNDDVRGDYSKIVKVFANRIGTKSAVMPAPKFVSIKTKNGVTKVTVKNIKFTSNPKKVAYKVSYRVKGAKKWNKSEFSFNNVKTIKGLKKGKTYNFALKYRYKSALDNKTFVYSKIVYKNIKVK